MKDYYGVLGVKAEDNIETIKQAYRKLAKKYHPDLHPGDKAAEDHFKEIGEAWGTLGDTGKRSKYDQTLQTTVKGAWRATSGKEESAQSSSAVHSQVSYENIMSSFDSFFSEDNLSKAAKEQRGAKPAKNPFDTNAMFEKFMGFKK